jgi:hypothetical protein
LCAGCRPQAARAKRKGQEDEQRPHGLPSGRHTAHERHIPHTPFALALLLTYGTHVYIYCSFRTTTSHASKEHLLLRKMAGKWCLMGSILGSCLSASGQSSWRRGRQTLKASIRQQLTALQIRNSYSIDNRRVRSENGETKRNSTHRAGPTRGFPEVKIITVCELSGAICDSQHHPRYTGSESSA